MFSFFITFFVPGTGFCPKFLLRRRILWCLLGIFLRFYIYSLLHVFSKINFFVWPFGCFCYNDLRHCERSEAKQSRANTLFRRNATSPSLTKSLFPRQQEKTTCPADMNVYPGSPRSLRSLAMTSYASSFLISSQTKRYDKEKSITIKKSFRKIFCLTLKKLFH